ncbi:MAG TPA: polysaccharide biosynthesis/export family protein, partial [Pyrinomonadaceae bacterium]|nr:polysaccharide biosynthesis/export family protein [Pyrinomonadaceae bacterium]
MKKFFFAAALALAVCVTCARASGFQSDGVRVGPAAEEKSAGDASAPAPKKGDKEARPPADSKGERREDASKKAAERRDADRAEGERVSEKSQNPSTLSTASATTAGNAAGPSTTSDAPPKPSAPAPVPVNTSAGATPAGVSPSAVTPAEPLTSVYRVGIGDVLDIRLLNDKDPRQSTLYTVLAGGALEYPLLHDPVTVAGMTTEELAAQLIADLRHRGIFQHPQVRVGVREYVSHTVLVSGLVG